LGAYEEMGKSGLWRTMGEPRGESAAVPPARSAELLGQSPGALVLIVTRGKAGGTMSGEENTRSGPDSTDQPPSASVTFVTTEHFTLQGARSAAITGGIGRATIFLGSVSAGLVALGLIATATRIGTAFYAFALILLPTLSFVGFATANRVLQYGIEELEYVERIARLRAYYFDHAPELTHYLASVPAPRRLAILGFGGGGGLIYRATPGMIAVVTAVLAGSAAGLIATIAAGHSAVAGFVVGGVVGAAVLAAMMWHLYRGWEHGTRIRLFEDE
jgi:hypothetical protein